MARINVTVGDNIDKKVTKYAEFMGMTKSSLCAYWIAQMAMSFDNAQNSVEKAINNMVDNEKKTKK